MVISDHELQAHAAHLTKLAYRMLGSASDAEEVAQEALARWLSAGRPEVESLRAWLTKVATRICLDRLKSSARKRERYVGDELPEPFITEMQDRAQIDETLSMALLVTIQRLGPRERAVFLLHDVFGYSFKEVAEVLELQPTNCRQLAVRARRHLQLGQVRSEAAPETVDRLSEAFFSAIQSGDTERLASLLSEDVVFRSDGGGKVPAAFRPIHGSRAVVGFLMHVLTGPNAEPLHHRRHVWFNGSPGVLVTDPSGEPVTAFQIVVHDDRIAAIYAQRNPDKLVGFRRS